MLTLLERNRNKARMLIYDVVFDLASQHYNRGIENTPELFNSIPDCAGVLEKFRRTGRPKPLDNEASSRIK
jgi:hypothetical protein